MQKHKKKVYAVVHIGSYAKRIFSNKLYVVIALSYIFPHLELKTIKCTFPFHMLLQDLLWLINTIYVTNTLITLRKKIWNYRVLMLKKVDYYQ